MKRKIYIASRTIHAPRWLQLRAEGVNIVSTWIDEAGPGDSQDMRGLSERCILEPVAADVTILYSEEGDSLKYALVEVGAALGAGKVVIVVGSGPSISATMLFHPNVIQAASLHDALLIAENVF